jgi:hypothetical protein
VTGLSAQINCSFNPLPVKGNHGERLVIAGLQLVLAILLLGAVVWIGDAISGGIEGALGEKPLRDRDS